MSLELRLTVTSAAVPEVRRLLRRHGIDVMLCVTELLTNVVDHVGEGTDVTVRVLGMPDGRTRVEVSDPDPQALPVVRRASLADESGRGLAVLDALALRWGVVRAAGHKTVWCEVDGEGEAGEASRPPGGGGLPGLPLPVTPSRSPSP
ncbi:ATP-binding protein [Streptomyces griseoaurantiacus]|uniref:ATP-binding protein n=1 Tax=Streptomyces griseoaurantiacus TaxID=68213 RepID=UPI002ED111BD|nr:ATP-binding protein [Streptomyces jietaisiensis]